MNNAPVFKDLNNLAQSLRSDIFVRFMKRAQKQALLEWRDRTTAPGLAARFTKAGKSFYGFSDRVNKKRDPYVKTGQLRTMLSKRRPHSKRSTDTEVVTALKFGGGALNFLSKKYGTKSKTTSYTTTVVQVRAAQRRAHNFVRSGKSFARRGGPVSGYSQAKTTATVNRIKSPVSFASEFAQFTHDGPWISQRARTLFATITRKAVIDRRTGGIKSSYLAEVEP
jgi:hypothetical protein